MFNPINLQYAKQQDSKPHFCYTFYVELKLRFLKIDNEQLTNEFILAKT